MNIQITIDAINEIDTSQLSREELEKQIERLKIVVQKLQNKDEN